MAGLNLFNFYWPIIRVSIELAPLILSLTFLPICSPGTGYEIIVAAARVRLDF